MYSPEETLEGCDAVEMGGNVIRVPAIVLSNKLDCFCIFTFRASLASVQLNGVPDGTIAAAL